MKRNFWKKKTNQAIINKNADEKEPKSSMSFLEHLEELRQRLLRCIIAIIVSIFICWFFREEIRYFLEAPLYKAWDSIPGLPPPTPLSFTSLMEPFVAYLKISAIAGLFLASPVIFYQLWKFISPGLYSKEKKLALPFVFFSSFLFTAGAAGAYTFVFPIGFSFFLQFSAGGHAETAQTEVNVQNISSDKQKQKSKTESEFFEDKDLRYEVIIDWFKENILKRNVYSFSAKEEKKSVALRYDVKIRGSSEPEIVSLKRNGHEVEQAFSKTKEGKKVSFIAVDEKPVKGINEYQVTVAYPAVNKLAPVLMVKDYLDFAIRLLLAFGLVFELPILIFFLAMAQIVTIGQLVSFGRWFVVLSVTIAAILTPPDIITQILLAIPLVALYYISVLIVYLISRKHKDQ